MFKDSYTLEYVEDVDPVFVYNILRRSVGITLEDILSLDLSYKDDRGVSFPKRLKKLYRNIPDSVLGELGSKLIAGRSTLNIEINQELWEPGDYGDYDSCFFRLKSGAKDLIFLNGGKAIKINSSDGGAARAWLLPYENNYYIFNIYSKGSNLLDKKNWLNILKEITGVYWKKISMYSKGELLYINDSTAYTPLSNPLDSVDIDLYYQCGNCGAAYFSNGSYNPHTEEFYCIECSKEYSRCDRCGEWFEESPHKIMGYRICPNCYPNMHICSSCGELRHDLDPVFDYKGDYVCRYCRDSYSACVSCGKLVHNDEAYYGVDGHRYCPDCGLHHLYCYNCRESFPAINLYFGSNIILCENCVESYKKCVYCGGYYKEEDLITIDSRIQVCKDCAKSICEHCSGCGKLEVKNYMTYHDGNYYCPDCNFIRLNTEDLDPSL